MFDSHIVLTLAGGRNWGVVVREAVDPRLKHLKFDPRFLTCIVSIKRLKLIAQSGRH